ncbi:hypothetical protein [Sphingosinicella sp. BN140058]|uniref:hypothetical protein n=1 Tax=Sphingosinicella sp. BN140058 TaxID=1892855 RepID=UPI00101067C0|nr:hypothetical protein [Sphingosinicella sp. BN140058]QAY75149.1 hypothetical protein ETR14_00345 [Sphingosinicella sp. BN140058]
MPAGPAFRRSIVVSGLLMLIGIAMLLGGAIRGQAPLWWTRSGALLMVAGAFVEILAVARHARSRR